MIYCHHHSKGAQGGKKAMDRASGSGVFARDPDALVDFTPLEMTEDYKNNIQDGSETPWRVEFVLREFASPQPMNVYFDWPLHRIDTSGDLASLPQTGSAQANLSKSSKRNGSPEKRAVDLDTAFQLNAYKGRAEIKAIADYYNVGPRTVANWVKEGNKYETSGKYIIEK